MSKTFSDIITEYNAISDQDKNIKLLELRKELAIPALISDIDIISDAPLLFLLVAKEIELLKKSDNARQQLAITYLKNANIQQLAEFNIEYCEVKNGTKSYAINYTLLGKCLAQKEAISKSFWRGIYLIVNSIYVSDMRSVGNWFETAQYMFGNFLGESYLVDTIPGLTFNPKGVRHDMLCATGGTKDPDFIYTEILGIMHTAEFKRPNKSIEALAAYAAKNPSYIYNADILFTYDPITLKFYKIDYTLPDPTTGTSYTITSLNITYDLSKIA